MQLVSGKVQATARVQVTVEFAVGGQVWGSDAPIEQVHRQAREAAIDILRRGLVIGGLKISPQATTSADIIGEPNVVAILVEAQL